ncbi:MAG: phosphatase PAP2 family protein [Methanobacteriota archaeon]
MATIATTAAFCFAALTWLVVVGETQGFDHAALETVYNSNTPTTLMIFRAVSFAGSMWAIAVVTCFAALYFTLRKRIRTSAFILASVSGAWLLNEVLKLAVSRARPELGSDVFATGYSYPSAHTMVGISLYITLAIALSPLVESPTRKAALWMSAVALVALIALSRPFLGAHWPTDVMGGALLGAAWVISLREIRMRYLQHEKIESAEKY